MFAVLKINSMFDLSKIYVGGSFYFSSGDNLKTKCKEAKVPNDCCGVYILYNTIKRR